MKDFVSSCVNSRAIVPPEAVFASNPSARDMMEDAGLDVAGMDTPEQVREGLKTFGRDHGPQELEGAARRHMRENQPQRCKSLKGGGMLEEVLDYAVEQTHREMSSLENAGLTTSEAWERTRQEYPFPPPSR